MSGISHMMLTDYTLATYNMSAARIGGGEYGSPDINGLYDFDVRTTGVLNGTVLYWTIEHITTSAADFTVTSGSFVIQNNGGSFQTRTIVDNLTEGTESFNYQIRTGSTTGPVVLTYGPATIMDTSTTPTTPTYSLFSYTSSPYEATVADTAGLTSYIIRTTNVPDGTTLYWALGYGTASAADFATTSGSFTITSGQGTFNFRIINDALTEGTETYYVYVKTGSVSGTNVLVLGPYNISDTSTTPLDTISTNLTTANRIVYAQAAQNDLIPISAAEYASYANGVPGIQAQSGMKDGGYASVNTISTIATAGPQRQTAFSTTYWVGVQAGYVFAVKVKTGEGPGVTIGTGFQIGYGTTTNGAGVAISNKLTRTTVTDADGFVYFVLKQPSVNVTAGVYMTILVNGFVVSFVGSAFPPVNNAGTTWVYAGASSTTPITQTLNNSGQYVAMAVSWLSTTTRPW